MEVSATTELSYVKPTDVQAKALLDFSKETLDVDLLDKVVMSFYSGAGQQVCIRIVVQWIIPTDAYEFAYRDNLLSKSWLNSKSTPIPGRVYRIF